MRHRFACEVAIDEALRDRADRDLALEPPVAVSAASGARSIPPPSTLICCNNMRPARRFVKARCSAANQWTLKAKMERLSWAKHPAARQRLC
jgi:hypothetical protein